MSFAENLAVLRVGRLPAEFRKPGVNLRAPAKRRGLARRVKPFDAAYHEGAVGTPHVAIGAHAFGVEVPGLIRFGVNVDDGYAAFRHLPVRVGIFDFKGGNGLGRRQGAALGARRGLGRGFIRRRAFRSFLWFQPGVQPKKREQRKGYKENKEQFKSHRSRPRRSADQVQNGNRFDHRSILLPANSLAMRGVFVMRKLSPGGQPSCI